MIVMVVGFLTVLIQGSAHVGGFHSALEKSMNGSRLNIFEYALCSFKNRENLSACTLT